MGENEFWSALEYRICRELKGMREPELKYMWCDGCHGYPTRNAAGEPIIEGTIWIGTSGNTEMQLEIALPNGVSVSDEIVWDELLPPEGLTGWLSIDPEKKRVAIDLSKAEPIKT